MQDRYVGDIGDYAKYALLRALAGKETQLGVAWYAIPHRPDELLRNDGQHIGYLRDGHLAALDTQLFNALGKIVDSGRRTIRAVEEGGIVPGAIFARDLLIPPRPPESPSEWRRTWFNRVSLTLASCDLVFADPDNGLCADEKFRWGSCREWKRMPLSEARSLANGRTAVIYHHNTRRPGGHAQEIEHWLQQFGAGAFALYWRTISNRTFFVVNATNEHRSRAVEFAHRWRDHISVLGNP